MRNELSDRQHAIRLRLAGETMATILDNVRFDTWKFRNLMPLRLQIFTQQQCPAGTATVRAELDDLLDVIERFE